MVPLLFLLAEILQSALLIRLSFIPFLLFC